jgi:hypothetical protein
MPYLKFAQPDMFELFGEVLLFENQRKKTRKLAACHSSIAEITDFSSEISGQENDVIPYEDLSVQENESQFLNDTSSASMKRKNSDIAISSTEPLICTTQVVEVLDVTSMMDSSPKISLTQGLPSPRSSQGRILCSLSLLLKKRRQPRKILWPW